MHWEITTITTIVILTIILPQLLYLRDFWCDAAYTYNPTKHRNPNKVRVQRTWEANDFHPSKKPWIPKRHFNITPEILVKVPDQPCQNYKYMERGVFKNKDENNEAQFRYGWKTYFKNCDIRKFLLCKAGKCNCMPGMYWDSTADKYTGSCVVRHGGNCTRMAGFDFRLYPKCGRTLRCDDITGSTPKRPEKRCVCKHLNAVLKNDTSPLDRDDYGNRKLNCKNKNKPSFHEPKDFNGACYEYAVKIDGKLKTRTSCGDTPGSGPFDQGNMICQFPKTGQRTDGTCVCKDSSMKFNPGKPRGCFTGVGTECLSNPNVCVAKLGLTCSPTGYCACLPGFIENPATKFCDKPSTTGGLGENCSPTEPCTGKNIECNKKSKCSCKDGYRQISKECKKFNSIEYGIPCEPNSTTCNTDDDRFVCAELSSLKYIYSKSGVKATHFCVCNKIDGLLGYAEGYFFNFDYNTTNDFCGSCRINLPSIIQTAITVVFVMLFFG